MNNNKIIAEANDCSRRGKKPWLLTFLSFPYNTIYTSINKFYKITNEIKFSSITSLG